MTIATQEKTHPCQQCGKCCETHPCALAPEDLPKIANFLSLTQEDLFLSFLVLDYVEDETSSRSFYVTPARKNEQPGRIVDANWTYINEPCVFLVNRKCSIEQVKPRGAKEFYCGLMTDSDQNLIGYSKKRSAQEWSQVDLLRSLVVLSTNTANKIRIDKLRPEGAKAQASTLGSSFTTLPTT